MEHPPKSLHQGKDVVPVHFRKITMATLWGLVGKWEEEQLLLRQGARSEWPNTRDVGEACKAVQVTEGVTLW